MPNAPSSPLMLEPGSDQIPGIEAELVQLLYKQSPIGVIATVANAPLLVFLLYGRISVARSIVWLSAISLVSVVRAGLIFAYHRCKDPGQNLAVWKQMNVITLALSGLLWGAGAIVFFPAHDGAYQVYIIVVLTGMVAGAAMAFGFIRAAFLSFSIPALLPLILRLLSAPGEPYRYLGILAVLYWLLSYFIAQNMRRTRVQLLELKQNLTNRVAERTQALEAANHLLLAENRERLVTEEHLRQERNRLETITAAIGAGLAVISKECRVLWANKVLKEIFGEVEGRLCSKIDSRQEGLCADCGVRAIFQEGREKAIREQEGRDVRGDVIWSQVITTSIQDSSGCVTAALELVLPITEQKHAQDRQVIMSNRLAEARKLEAIATLAGGIAHQFNNALAVIVGNIELLQYDQGQDAAIAKYIEPMASSAKQMAQLTSQLLAYAKGGKYKTQIMDMAAFIKTTLPLLHHTLKPDITITTALTEGLAVKMDLTQMQMVLGAILANASEAININGKIHIAGRERTIGMDEGFQFGDMLPGLYLELTVTDNGCGMDADTLKRIFDPFFSTKFEGRGMGLPAVYGIVKNHGGHIEVLSETGRGAQVKILLPASRASAGPVELSGSEPVRGQGAVLLVEDEALVMDVSRAILARLGYQVLPATTGKAAIDLIRQVQTPLDLVLLDIKLPDMDGAAIFPLIRQCRPGVKVLVCSGYALNGPTQALMEAGADGFIQKPFTLSGLSEKLKAILTPSDPPA